MSNVRIGCAIWGYRPWVGDFLPAGTTTADMLTSYAQRLTTVEINATFYAIPEITTVARWADEVPADFRFCPKIPQAISHAGKLSDNDHTMEVFVQHLQPLRSRLGRVFLQLPPRYGAENMQDLQTWLERWSSIIPLAVEVRQRSWFVPQNNAELNRILNEYDVSRVLVDVRPINTGKTNDPLILEARRKKPNVPFHTDITNQECLLRFMGHPDLAIDKSYLSTWADFVIELAQQNINVYAFMHCPAEEQSPILCQMLADMLHQRGLAHPLPSAPSQPEQLSML